MTKQEIELHREELIEAVKDIPEARQMMREDTKCGMKFRLGFHALWSINDSARRSIHMLGGMAGEW